MEEDFFDILERMESLVPEYKYRSIKEISATDRKIREFLIEQMKKVKTYLFDAVQISYELDRDRLSEETEDAWEEVDIAMDRVENSSINKLKGKKRCDDCRKHVEKNLQNLIRRDRELVLAVQDLERTGHMLNRSLFMKGKERYFIKNLSKIKPYCREIDRLLQEREKILTGG